MLLDKVNADYNIRYLEDKTVAVGEATAVYTIFTVGSAPKL